MGISAVGALRAGTDIDALATASGGVRGTGTDIAKVAVGVFDGHLIAVSVDAARVNAETA